MRKDEEKVEEREEGTMNKCEERQGGERLRSKERGKLLKIWREEA